MVQTILSSMDSDEVNSITDTTEALQVAYVIRSVFYRIASSADLPEHESVFNLTASSSSTPTVMYRPATVNRIDWIKYNKADLVFTDPLFTDIQFMPLKDFLDMQYQLDDSNTYVEGFDVTVNTSDTFKVLCRNDKHPEFFTTFDDLTVLFDSYNSAVETNLQSSKSLGFGSLTQTFLLTDGFIPALDEQQFDLLLNEAKSWCHLEMKQMPHQKAEQAARRGWINLQRSKHAFPHEDKLPDYGRRKV